jgi:DNA-binding CsgD family transcriptional regulator/tetratricopeptide (TPR) repeat protein
MIYACELDKGRVALDEALALARRQDDEALVAESLAHLGLAASFAGQHDEGELLLSEALALTRQLGPEPHTSLLVMVFSEMAIAELRRSDYQAALLHLDDALANFVTVGDQRGGAAARILQAHTQRRMGDVNGAVTMLREAIIEGLRFLDPILLGAGAGITFLLSTDCVEPPPRTRLLGAAEALSERAGAGIILEKLAGETLDRFHVEVEQAEMLKEYRRGRLLSLEEAATAALACLDDIDRPAEREREATSGGRSALTQTEQRVLGLVAAGIPDKQIARELGIAERTVRRHVSSILRTLEASSRSHAVAMAMQRGML